MKKYSKKDRLHTWSFITAMLMRVVPLFILVIGKYQSDIDMYFVGAFTIVIFFILYIIHTIIITELGDENIKASDT